MVNDRRVSSLLSFTVYIDDLLLQLETAGIGCFWSHHYVGAACYADDIVLHAPLWYLQDIVHSFLYPRASVAPA